MRASDGTRVHIKASEWAFEEIGTDRIVKVAWSGEKLAGDGRVHIEVPIHTRVMQTRPEVHATVHCHAPAITALASLNQPIRPISHEGVYFANRLPRFEVTGNLIDTFELGDAHALIIPQHGLVAAEPDVPSAVMYAVLRERACRIQLQAAAAGGPAVWSSDEEVDAKAQICFQPFERTCCYLVDIWVRTYDGRIAPIGSL